MNTKPMRKHSAKHVTYLNQLICLCSGTQVGSTVTHCIRNDSKAEESNLLIPEREAGGKKPRYMTAYLNK